MGVPTFWCTHILACSHFSINQTDLFICEDSTLGKESANRCLQLSYAVMPTRDLLISKKKTEICLMPPRKQQKEAHPLRLSVSTENPHPDRWWTRRTCSFLPPSTESPPRHHTTPGWPTTTTRRGPTCSVTEAGRPKGTKRTEGSGDPARVRSAGRGARG